MTPTTKRVPHAKLSNAAFTRQTGYRWVCMDCRQNNETAAWSCPGKTESKPEPAP